MKYINDIKPLLKKIAEIRVLINNDLTVEHAKLDALD